MSEERFRAMFEEAPLGVAQIDSRAGHIHMVNPRFAEVAGRTREEMARIDWMSITHPDDLQEELANMALLNAGEIPGFKMNKRYRRPDGSYEFLRFLPPATEGGEVRALFRLLADGGLRCLVFHKRADKLAELILFLSKCEVHAHKMPRVEAKVQLRTGQYLGRRH